MAVVGETENKRREGRNEYSQKRKRNKQENQTERKEEAHKDEIVQKAKDMFGEETGHVMDEE
ncbi:hypothetical protein [Staphylococcus simulans]